jgi:hypothetical protein
MAALKIKCPWKRYITQAQMLQFVIVFAHAVYVLVDGRASKPTLSRCVPVPAYRILLSPPSRHVHVYKLAASSATCSV